jgi:signal transduction histidine kinase/DNA-binding response OmpR family regulator
MGAAGLGIVVARAWTRRPPSGVWADLPIHLAIGSATGAVIASALIPEDANPSIAYYLVLVPSFAACLVSVRATLFWALVAIAGFLVIGQASRFAAFADAGPPASIELMLGQTTLVLMIFGAAYSQWRTTNAHVTELREREARIREQAAELEHARDAALRASRVKSEFLATVSHEIRTPMNAVIGLTDLVLDTRLDTEQRSLLATARRSGESLVDILNDILDFSKIESDRIELEERAFSLRACIEDALELLAPRAAEQRDELLYDHPIAVHDWIVGDPVRVRQVVVNLVSNAIKFTTDGDVTVRVEQLEADGDRLLLRIAVRDTGIGIPPDRWERLFQPFSQVDASTTRRFGGTGLGLAISRRLVERMGGAISVESEPGHGSEFWFTLPTHVSPHSAGEPRFDAAQLAGRSLLVVHDHARLRAMLMRDAADRGMRVHAAASLDEALRCVRAGERFEALLVDGRALLREGLDAMRALRDALPAPALLLTSPGELPAALEEAASEIFTLRLGRPLRGKHIAEALVGVWLNPDAARAARELDEGGGGQPRLADRIPLRVLVAEDNAVNQRVVRTMLQRLGYEPDIASDGVKAVEAVRRRQYDLILMDMQMPELDGLDATRAIRALGAERRDTHIVALTANAMVEDRRRCLEAGMDDFLSKPLSARRLREAIERCGAERAGDGGLGRVSPTSA